jgi:hypothetical protein
LIVCYPIEIHFYMKSILSLFSILIIGLEIKAQSTFKKLDFGKVKIEDVAEKFFPADSTQATQTLYDYAEISFDAKSGDFVIRMEVHEIKKIYKKSALDIGNFKFTLPKANGNFVTMSGIKGFTHSLVDGKLVSEKLNKDDIKTDRSVDGEVSIQFSLPNVKEGSVIEYTYVKETPFYFSHNPPFWSFQADHPVRLSLIDIVIPNNFTYRTLMRGYLGLTYRIVENKDARFDGNFVPCTRMQFGIENIPAFKSEEFVDNNINYMSSIEFELAAVDFPGAISKNFSLDFNDLNKTFLNDDSFGEIIKNTRFMKDTAKEILAKHKDTTAQINAAIKHIQNTIKWNENYGAFAYRLRKISNKGEGDAGDINLSLLCLLKEMDYEVYPVILSTRSNGQVGSYPLVRKYNYVVVMMMHKGKEMFLDATSPFLETGMLPHDCLNGTGWMVKEGGGRLVVLKPSHKSTDFTSGQLVIDEEGQIEGDLTLSFAGYSGLRNRKNWKENGKDKVEEGIKKNLAAWEIDKLTFENLEDYKTGPFSYKLKLKALDNLNHTEDRIFLNPLLNFGYETNPFTSNERAYPVNFAYAQDETINLKFTMPQGYELGEKPKNIVFALPEGGGRFIYNISNTDKDISVISRLQINKAVFTAEEYQDIKAFFDKIVETQSQQIEIKKSTTAK